MAIKKYVGDKYVGLSSDTKPTNVADGATFYETDTLQLYLKVGGSWNLNTIQGYTGSAGVNGYTGSQGVTGFTGSQGSIGFTGSAGSNGFTGSVGFTGSAGKVDVVATTPPSPLYEGQLWFDSESTKVYAYYDNYWIEVGSSEVGLLYNRKDFSISTSSLADDASENLNLTAYKSYVLMKASTSHACWVRIYSDAASRTADESRSQGTDPTAGSGVIAEFITTGSETQKITPFIFGGSLENPPTTTVYLRVTNLSGSTNTINIGLTLTRLEI